MKRTKHKHRILPGHRGGTYDEGNVVELTITQHAMWHFAEWQLHREVEDMVAWKGLAGMITKEEAIRLIQQETCRETGFSNRGKTKDAGFKIGVNGTEKKAAWWDARPEKRRERYEKMRAGLKDPSAGGKRTKLEGKGIFAPGVTSFETCSKGGKTGSKNTNSQLWEDPLHPELGAHHFNRLAAVQRSNNLPHSKENRRKIQ
jgi:hypothetical protein